MPFTFCHPALVLPLARYPHRWVSLTGLVAGSMAPDFEYFIRMKLTGEFGHSLWGIFWFDLPVGLLIAFVFHLIVRNSLIRHLPAFLQARLITFRSFDWPEYFKKHGLAVILSVLTGTASHILWDSFTHADGFMVRHFSVLKSTLQAAGFSVPVYKILQHGSSLIGGLVIAVAILNLPKVKINLEDTFPVKYWSVLILISLTIISLRVFLGPEEPLFGHLIATAISAVLIALILTPLLLKNNYIRSL